MNTKESRLFEAIKKEELILAKLDALNEELGAHLEELGAAHDELVELVESFDNTDLKVYDFFGGYLVIDYDVNYDYFTSRIVIR